MKRREFIKTAIAAPFIGAAAASQGEIRLSGASPIHPAFVGVMEPDCAMELKDTDWGLSNTDDIVIDYKQCDIEGEIGSCGEVRFMH